MVLHEGAGQGMRVQYLLLKEKWKDTPGLIVTIPYIADDKLIEETI